MDVRAKRDRERELNARIVTERTSGGGQLVVVENVGSADDDMDDGAGQSKNLYTWVCGCVCVLVGGQGQARSTPIS